MRKERWNLDAGLSRWMRAWLVNEGGETVNTYPKVAAEWRMETVRRHSPVPVDWGVNVGCGNAY